MVLALPQYLPSVHEVSSDEEASVHAVTADDCSSHYLKSSDFSLTTHSDVQSTSTAPGIDIALGEVNIHSTSSPNPSLSTPTSTAPSVFSQSSSTLTSVRKSLKRFTSRTKGNFFTSDRTPDVYQTSQPPSTSNEAQGSSDAPHILPELSFDTSPLSIFIHEEQDIKESPPEDQELEDPPEEPNEVVQPATEGLPIIKFEFVDPQELTASPAITLGTSYSISGASFQSPSPSWLSRNVGSYDPSLKPQRPLLRIHPPSPEPLPVLPRGFLEIPQSSGENITSEVRTDFRDLFARYI